MTERNLCQLTEQIRASDDGPFYFIDFEGIEDSIMSLRTSFESIFPRVSIAYSYKTNSLQSITEFMRSKSLGAEVVSGQELEWALLDKFEEQNIYFNGPIKSKPELRKAADLNIKIQIDSISELNDLLDSASNPAQLQIGARLSMPYNNQGDSRFGLSKTEFKDAYGLMQSMGLAFSGLHLHIGSNIASVSQYRDSILSRIDILCEIWDELSWIDFGGGFPAYTVLSKIEGDVPSSKEFSQCIKSILDDYELSLENKTIVLEPGRSLVEDNGYLLARVEIIKNRENRRIVVTNAGLNLVKSMHSWSHPIVFLREPHDQESIDLYEVYGCNCFESDVLHQALEGPADLKKGDWIVIGSTGGYDMQNFNTWTQSCPSVYGSYRDGIKKIHSKLSPLQMRQSQALNIEKKCQ